MSNPKLKTAIIAGIACLPLLTAATCSTQQVTDINALLGNSAASTMLAYLAGLDPQVSSVLADVDTAIANDAPGVLKIACGGGSAANFVFQTAGTLDPALITPAMVQEEAAAFGVLSKSCPPNPPPTSLADAARAAWAAYQQIMAGVQSANVTVPKTTAALRR